MVLSNGLKQQQKVCSLNVLCPITSGLTRWGSPLSIWQNIAETSNQGVEVTINSHNIKPKILVGIPHYL